MFKQTDDELQKRILRLLKSKNLELIYEQDFPFSSLGTLARIRDGEFPKSHRVRSLFELPSMVTVVPCANCGGMHPIRKCSPKKPKLKCTATKKDIAMISAYVMFFKKKESNAIA